MEKRRKIITVTNREIIADLRDKEDYTLLYPLKSFCVGYPLEFTIDEIDDFVLVNRLLTNKDIENLKKILKIGHIKGIVFEDLGIISLLKDLKIEKILMLSHLANNVKSINIYLEYVDSVIISTDITKEEIRYILNNATKKLVLPVFGLIPLMYSRRMLLTNYAMHHNIKREKMLEAETGGKYFKIIENDYGTIFYPAKYFFLDDYKTYPNVYAQYYNPLFLTKEEIFQVLDDNFNNIPTFSYLLDKKTYYNLKESDK